MLVNAITSSHSIYTTAPVPQEFDFFACALDGVNQIEASAGTGKTWHICALYVRLLLEQDLKADQILVVTFTKVATAELYKRIRGRLAQLAHALERGDDGGDPFVARLFEITLGEGDEGSWIDAETAAKRIRCALPGFDQAAIYTIHAFCQHALQEAPFSAAMPFDFEIETDDAAMRFELATEFWRTRVEPMAAVHPGFAAWLVVHCAGPEALDIQLVRRLKKPLAVLRFDGLPDPYAPGTDCDFALRASHATAAALWQAERAAIASVLERAQASLNQRSHKPEAVTDALSAWDAYFGEAAGALALVTLPKSALKLTRTLLEKATKKGCAPPRHPFFEAVEVLKAALADAEAAQRARWLALSADWLAEAPSSLAEKKRTRRVASYDDLLINLYHALEAHPRLADTLRRRYPVALIDEFQDTDPLQFAIFDRIFAPAGPLFLVGDPKQAIYSFRAADLHTYLAARERAGAHYTLAMNQRSTPAIVDACNRIFGANPRAFVLDGLDYQPVRAGMRQRPPFIDGTDPHAGSGDFRIWMLPDGDEALGKRDAQWQAVQACAAEIARLIRGAQEGSVRLGEAALTPADIAVLVQTHRQGSIVKRVLAAWAIGSVELAQASVFATLDAEQFGRVLAAVDTPGDLRRLRAALATDWFGLDAAALWRLKKNDAAHSGTAGDADVMSWVERFSRYRLLWRERGFAVMWRSLARELRIAERLIGGTDGERRLTDINHLAELTQTRASAQPGIAPTLRWLAAQRAVGGGEDAQLRLESDRNLVQIVTVHKSKGLEYAVVFYPFLNDGRLYEPSEDALPAAREYHDEAGTAVLHYGCDEASAERVATQARREQAAERVRLVYVALTRAVHRCYLVAGVYQTTRSTREARRSVLNWLVGGAGHGFDAWLEQPPEAEELAASWRALATGPISIAPLPDVNVCTPLAARHDAERFGGARQAARFLRDTWRITSFSSLMASIEPEQEVIATVPDDTLRPDHDALAVPGEPVSSIDGGEYAMQPDPDDIVAFPRGAAAGECLHRLFELSDFGDASGWDEAARRALQERPVEADPELAGRLPTMMTRMLADVVTTELVPGMRFTAIDPGRRLNEMEFLFSVAALDFAALRALLVGHGYPDVALESDTLVGFFKGFIDMIVEHNDRFWIVDWKSNHLGATPDAYGPVALNAVIANHAYHLQALLYTVALHRYLRVRLPGYDYDTHMAGYLYLFVRGVRPGWSSGGWPSGVHTRRPSRDLVEALDALMRKEHA